MLESISGLAVVRRMSVIIALVVSIAGLFILVFGLPEALANTSPGQWADVCCGQLCKIDYCLGNGSYACCK